NDFCWVDSCSADAVFENAEIDSFSAFSNTASAEQLSTQQMLCLKMQKKSLFLHFQTQHLLG
ncbi:hypothetical protein PSW70_23745, partial [Shigella flexneri]|nr:hypothetical protein [Shigella flexneri]